MVTAEKDRKSKLLFRFVPTQRLIENSQQIAKKFIKFEEYRFGFISSINWLRNAKEERIKIIVLHRSYMTRNRKLKKKFKKIQKIIKYYYGFISSQNKGENAEKERK